MSAHFLLLYICKYLTFQCQIKSKPASKKKNTSTGTRTEKVSLGRAYCPKMTDYRDGFCVVPNEPISTEQRFRTKAHEEAQI